MRPEPQSQTEPMNNMSCVIEERVPALRSARAAPLGFIEKTQPVVLAPGRVPLSLKLSQRVVVSIYAVSEAGE
jgi:hypothetical protein